MIESSLLKKKYEFDDDNIHHMKCCYCLGMSFALDYCNHLRCCYLLQCLQMVDETMVVDCRIHQSCWSHRPMMEVQWAWLENFAAVPIVVLAAAVVMSVE